MGRDLEIGDPESEPIRRRKKGYGLETSRWSSPVHEAGSFAGQSMSLSWMRSALLWCRTSMVSPSRMETTGPEKSARAVVGMSNATNRSRFLMCAKLVVEGG
jgi:hypothetical protein